MTHKPLITMLATALVASTPMLVHSESRNAKSNDQQITDRVKQKLAMNDPGIAPHILVTTRDGVVTLMGMEVPEDNILTAVHDAKSVDGVVRVDNRLKPE